MNYIINISTFCLPIILFLFWSTVGYAALSLLRTQRNTIQNLLIAPTVGFTISLLPIYSLNRYGLPIQQFAISLFASLLLSSVFILLCTKPVIPLKRYLPFLGLCFLAMLLTGEPLLKFGLDWISYGNDDMTNYVLAATRFLNNGYYDAPTVDTLINGTDYSSLFWFMHAVGHVRAGADLTLAWISGVTHLSPLSLFMPITLAFHLMVICAAGAMVYTSKNKCVALLACFLLVISPLETLAVLYQLMPQVIGMALLITIATLLYQTNLIHLKYYYFKQGVLIALMFSSLLITYPEVTPFLVVSFVLYIAVIISINYRVLMANIPPLILATIITLIILNKETVGTFLFLYLQGTQSIGKLTNTHIFPYFFYPSGAANLWGLIPIAVTKFPLIENALILSGFALSIFFMVYLVKLFIRRTFIIPTIMMVIMTCVAVELFSKYSGFGLFKLAMMMQPFIACIVAVIFLLFLKPSRLKYCAALVLILLQCISLEFYITRSKGLTPGQFTEIVYGSSTKINKEYQQIISSIPNNSIIISNDFNPSIIKIQMLNSKNFRYYDLALPHIQYHGGSYPFMEIKILKQHPIVGVFYNYDEFLQIYNTYLKDETSLSFNRLSPNLTPARFTVIKSPLQAIRRNRPITVILDGGQRSIINNRYHTIDEQMNFFASPLNKIQNQLSFIESNKGHSYIGGSRPTTSLYNIENDYTYKNHIMQAIGNFLLFRIFNPSPRIRLEVNITNNFNGDRRNSLPDINAIGNSRVSLHTLGRGSARVFSEPFSAQLVEGDPYIAAELITQPIQFPDRRTWTMKLFNRDLPIDVRKFATFARDISVISEADYEQLNAPTEISHFPDDLANIQLEYSGMYEDGWISEAAFFKLKQTNSISNLIIKGMVPQIDPEFKGSNISIYLDGKLIISRYVTPGNFNIEIPVTSNHIRNHKVELHFSNYQNLPKKDRRPVAALINFIGFS